MEYRTLGGSGLKVSEAGLGTNTFGRYCDEAQTKLVIDTALDQGVNFIDTADSYTGTLSEQYIGKAISGRRDKVILATKTANPLGKGPNDQGLSYGRVIASCEASLKRLDTDYIDLYYLHRPDPLTPLSETLRALDDLMHQGKIRYIGISNYPAWQACEILWTADRYGYRPPVVTQNGYHLLDRRIESELLPFCQAHNVGIIPYTPLAGGLLSGKYRPGETPQEGTRAYNSPFLQRVNNERNLAIVAQLDDFAHSCDHTLPDLAIAWLLSHPEIPSVIAGATKPEQVIANAAATAWKLMPDEVGEVEKILARPNQ